MERMQVDICTARQTLLDLSTPLHRDFAKMIRLALVFGSCLLVGCVSIGSSGPRARMEITTGDTVTYRQSVSAVSFDLRASLHNVGQGDIAFRPCPVAAEKLVNNRWRQVWVQACLPVDGPPHIIPAGERFETNVSVGGFTDGSAGPPFEVVDSIPGTYRLRFSLFSISKDEQRLLSLPTASTASNPFLVRTP